VPLFILISHVCIFRVVSSHFSFPVSLSASPPEQQKDHYG